MTREEDIALAEIVRKSLAVYDKAVPEYHRKDVQKNCWNVIATDLGLESGDAAKKTSENIRKRFNKARNEMTKKSGTSTQEAMESAGDIDGYEYLMWFVPFITVRKTKSNITSINSSTENEPVARDLEDELEDEEDEGNAEELNLPKNDLEISSELDETRTLEKFPGNWQT